MPPEPSFFVHESSYVDDGAEVGPGTKIWHFCHVMSGATIGKNCVIGQNVLIGPGAVIGNGVKIQNNVSVYQGVTLDDGVFCGPSMVFTNVMHPRSEFPKKKGDYVKTLVKKGATIGANATIVAGITLGKYCFIGAGSVVTRDVPDFAVIYGNPARLKGWSCVCGLALDVEDGRAKCRNCSRQYTVSGGICRAIESSEDIRR